MALEHAKVYSFPTVRCSTTNTHDYGIYFDARNAHFVILLKIDFRRLESSNKKARFKLTIIHMAKSLAAIWNVASQYFCRTFA